MISDSRDHLQRVDVILGDILLLVDKLAGSNKLNKTDPIPAPTILSVNAPASLPLT